MRLPRKKKKRIKNSDIYYSVEEQSIVVRYNKQERRVNSDVFLKNIKNWAKSMKMDYANLTMDDIDNYALNEVFNLKMN